MPIERALNTYKTKRMNCAQSVLHAFQTSHAISEHEIEQARALGGGRAAEGLCGALFAAIHLTLETANQQRLKDAFMASAGSDKCREIRRTSRIPCSECVRLAASLVVAQSGAGDSYSPERTNDHT